MIRVPKPLRAAAAGLMTLTAAAVTDVNAAHAADCDPVPEATQGNWPKSKALEVTRGLFTKVGAADLEAHATAMLRSVSDNNMSWIPLTIDEVAQERLNKSLDIVQEARAQLSGDASVSRDDLNKAAAALAARTDFPSDEYKDAIVAAVKTGSWTAVTAALAEVKAGEVKTMSAAIERVSSCRAGHNSRLSL